jgi:hypothetical protein
VSNQLNVGTNANGLLWGRQPASTLINSGNVTVYLGDDSTVTPGVDYALIPGASFEYAEGSTVWGITDPDAVEVGRLQVIFDSWGRFEEAGSGTRLLYNAGIDASTQKTVAFSGTSSSVFGSVTIDVYVLPGQGGTVAGMGLTSAGVIGLTWQEQQPPLLTDVVSLTVPNTQQHSAAYYIKPSGVTSIVSGAVVASATFPNVTGSAGAWSVSFTNMTLTAGKLGVRVYSTAAPVQQTTVTGAHLYQVPTLYTANGTVAGSYVGEGNSFSATGMTQAASTTTRYIFPNLSGPVRVLFTGTQTGAGTVTGTPTMQINAVTDTWQQFDTALFTSAAAGSIFASATYAVWPTGPMGFSVVTPAGVTLSGVTLSLISGAA